MARTDLWAMTVIAGVLAACTREPPKPAQIAAPPAAHTVLEFEISFDAASRTVQLSAIGSNRQGLAPVPVVQDGVPGSGPVNTVELVTVNPRFDAACPPSSFSAFCADVTLRSFFNASIDNAVVEIMSITPPTGHAGLNSDPPFMGTSNALGLWVYGTIAGSGGNGTRTWSFQNDGTNFSIKGHVLGDLALAPGVWDTSSWDNAVWQ